jgi:hypothetical protein
MLLFVMFVSVIGSPFGASFDTRIAVVHPSVSVYLAGEAGSVEGSSRGNSSSRTFCRASIARRT